MKFEITSARELCERLAPELAGNLNVVQCPAELPSPEFVGAYCLTSPCEKLESILARTGELRGRGPSILFCDEYHPVKSLGILWHELGHPLPYKSSDYTDSAPHKFDESQIAAFTANPSGEVADYPWWFPSHDGKWIRRVLHLWWRAALAGYFTPLESLHAAGSDYQLSRIDAYWEALGAEPVKMQHNTFAEIESEPYPAAFKEIWKLDILDWARIHRKDSYDALIESL
jgi:hypothetical protein